MRLDDASRADLPALAALMAASPLLRRYGVTFGGAEAALRQALAAGDAVLVARPEREVGPAGFAWVIGTRILSGVAYLRLLLVAPEQQGNGVGARLLEAAEARARSAANHLCLLVTSDNLGARRFYERHGYRHVGDLPGHVLPEIDESLYQKPLRPHDERLPF